MLSISSLRSGNLWLGLSRIAERKALRYIESSKDFAKAFRSSHLETMLTSL